MDLRAELEPALIWATPGQRGFQQEPPKSRARKGAKATTQIAALHSSQMLAGPSMSQNYGAYSTGRTAAQQAANIKLQEDLQKAVELKQILTSLEKVDDESRRDSLLDRLLSTDDVLTLPVYPNPPGVENGQLKVNLLKHQVTESRDLFPP
jgi:SWI/SNF-related matrix-associated actin-dependent regulator of chromatin subfamily A3